MNKLGAFSSSKLSGIFEQVIGGQKCTFLYVKQHNFAISVSKSYNSRESVSIIRVSIVRVFQFELIKKNLKKKSD